MRKHKTFKPSQSLEDAVGFVRESVGELTGAKDGSLPVKVRVTVETVNAPDFAFAGVLSELGLVQARQKIDEFLAFRRDDKRDPIKTVDALRRLLRPFQGRPDILVEAIDNSLTQGWKGLFKPKGGPAKPDRKIERGGNDRAEAEW